MRQKWTPSSSKSLSISVIYSQTLLLICAITHRHTRELKDLCFKLFLVSFQNTWWLLKIISYISKETRQSTPWTGCSLSARAASVSRKSRCVQKLPLPHCHVRMSARSMWTCTSLGTNSAGCKALCEQHYSWKSLPFPPVSDVAPASHYPLRVPHFPPMGRMCLQSAGSPPPFFDWWIKFLLFFVEPGLSWHEQHWAREGPSWGPLSVRGRVTV